MSCTYSTIEIQRTPEFRVYKKCLFHNLSCAEVRGSGKCPLLKRVPAEGVAKTASSARDVRDVLSEELQRFDGIPGLGGESKLPEGGRVAEIERTEPSKPKVAMSEVDLLKAELSDFMDKMETKKEKIAVQEGAGARKRVQGGPRKVGTRKTGEK